MFINPVMMTRAPSVHVVATAAGVTWNPSDNGGLTLSNGNLTATGPAASGPKAVRGTVAISGKKYLECTTMFIAADDTAAIFGFATAAHDLTKALAQSGSGFESVGVRFDRAVMAYGGGIDNNLANNGGEPRAFGIAIDTSVTKAWFRCMDGTAGTWDGTWNGDVIGNQNPVGGVGGFDYSINVAFGGSGGAYYPACSCVDTQCIILLNSGASSFWQAAPSGFSGL